MALPDELIRNQPYSMGPLLRWAPLGAVPQPPASPSAPMDRFRAEAAIAMCLHAPRSVQREARNRGINAVMMIRPRGIEMVNPALAPTPMEDLP